MLAHIGTARGEAPSAHLFELGACRHLLRPECGLDAVEEALQPTDQLRLRDPYLRFGWDALHRDGQRLEFLLEVGG